MAKSESEITWRDLNIGTIVTEPGSSVDYRTGSWRSQRPVLDSSKCIRCGMCYIFCPEGCIKLDEKDQFFKADLYHCKGCGICAKECPAKAITMAEEEE